MWIKKIPIYINVIYSCRLYVGGFGYEMIGFRVVICYSKRRSGVKVGWAIVV